MKPAEVFRSNYLVVGLPDETIAEIAELAKFETAFPRQALINKGERSNDLFVILDGRVEVYTSSGDVLTEAGPGSVLGEVALVDDQPRSADAVCMTTVSYARLPGKELRRYMWQNKEAGFIMLANLARVLSARLRSGNITIEDLMGRAEDPWRLAT